jgi:HEAT repeat protein
MNVPRLRVWHLLMLVAACAGFLAVFQYRQGVYNPTFGRLRQVRYADSAGKVAAIKELMEAVELARSHDTEVAGAAVVETLLEALGDPDPAVRGLAARAVAEAVYLNTARKNPQQVHSGAVKAALTDALRDPDSSVRVRAANGLNLLDVKSEESFAVLLQAARTPAPAPRTIGDIDDRFGSLGDLAYCYRDKPEAVAAILAAMTDRDPRVRKQGIIALNIYLRRSGPAAEPIAEALLARLDDEDDSIRLIAGQVLSVIGRSVARRAVPLLIRNLEERPSAFRVPTVNTLRQFGVDAEEARPALRALAEGNGPGDGRKAARDALEAIDTACRTFNDETLPELIADLGHENPAPRAAAAAELTHHGPRAQAAVPALTKALDDPEPKVRRAALAALEAMGGGRL